MKPKKPLRPPTTGGELRATLEKIQLNTDRLCEGNLSSGRLLTLVYQQRQLGNHALDLAILIAREKGTPWSTIAASLRLSPQAVEQRMRRLASTSVERVSGAESA